MKKFIYIECLVISIVTLSSCDKDLIISPSGDIFLYETMVSNNNFISLDQVENYVCNNWPKTKGNGERDYTITTYGEIDNTPLLYIINYGGGNGWQILSSDARTPSVIAQGDNGYFSLEEGSPAVRIWLDLMAADIAAVRNSSDDYLTFSAEEIAANKRVWFDDGSKDGDDGSGHWETTVSSQVFISEEIEHMTPQWDQDEPYNAYCPLTLNSSSVRAPAGCVAVAAAEVLYYLHSRLGVPEEMNSYGYCTGNILDFTQYFSVPSSTVWAQMDTSSHLYYQPADAEAIMIGSVGVSVMMHFDYNILNGQYFSWTLPANIRTHLFSPRGISSSHGNYDASIVRSNLENYLPVIVTASDQLIPANGDIHTFVIDGFQKTYTKYTYYHHWVTDDPLHPKGHVDPDHMPYITYFQSAPAISAIKINWGWKSQWHGNQVNNGWFSITAGWTVTNGGTYDYNHNIQMIYDMAVAEQ